MIRMALRNVLAGWRRNLAVLLSISAGFLALALFQGYIHGVQRLYESVYSQRAMLGDLIIDRADSAAPGFDPSEQARIEETLAARASDLEARMRSLAIQGIVSDGISNAIFAGLGYDLDAGEKLRRPGWSWNAVAGAPLDVARAPDGIIIGKTLATLMGCETAPGHKFTNGLGGYRPERRPFRCARSALQLSATTEGGQANAMDGEIVGILDAVFKNIDERFVAMSLESAQRLLGTGRVDSYSLRLKNPADAPALAASLGEELRSRGVGASVRRWQDHPVAGLYPVTVRFLGFFQDFIVLVLVVIAGLSVLNTVTAVMRERTREIGTLRSFGYTRGRVSRILLTEAGFLALIGIALGAAASLGMAAAINWLSLPYKAGILTEPVPFWIAWKGSIFVQSAVGLVVATVLSAAVPIRAAVRRSIAENLAS